MILRAFRVPAAVAAVVLAAAFVVAGVHTALIVAMLGILEISLSFDNAVVNARFLTRLNDAWQRVFLTAGIAIAVFGMRLVFPVAVVSASASISPASAVRLALDGGSVHTPGTYAYLLHEAHPQIAAFGGMFLLLLALDWLLDTERDVHWLVWLERPLCRIGRLDQLSVILGGLALFVAANAFAAHPAPVFGAGILGIVTYLAVNSLGNLFEESAPGGSSLVKASGKAAFFLFLYLEVLDASFSFDGVIGAFAISSNIFIIAAGLGIGAMFIRSLTVTLVRCGALAKYVYLEHGAQWAITALAVIMLVSIGHEVPEVVTGLIGVGFIGAAFGWSAFRGVTEIASLDEDDAEQLDDELARV